MQLHIKLTVETPGEYIAVYATDVNANGKFLSLTYFTVSQGVLWLPICLFSLYVASWWAVCSFCFWYGLKGISSWNNLINSSYLLFFLSFFLLDWLSSLSLFTASLMMAKLLSSFYSNCPAIGFKKWVSFWTEEQSQTHTSDVMPPSERSEGHMWFCFSLSLCLCEHAVVDLMLSLFQPFIGSYWVCAWRCSCRPTLRLGLSPLPMLLATALFCLDSVFCF